MTDRIDLDDIDEPADEQDDDPADWLSGDADPDAPSDGGPDVTPRVPADQSQGPVGIPKDQGGEGSGAGTPARDDDGPAREEREDGPTAPSRGTSDHGGDPGPNAEMTTAFTWNAVQALADPAAAVADAKTWSDFVGVVGDVDAHVLSKFQRDETVDLDFFNGSGTGPAERLAGVDERSMFYADRMVVVGTPADSWLGEQTNWEFVALADAADGAGWDVETAE